MSGEKERKARTWAGKAPKWPFSGEISLHVLTGGHPGQGRRIPHRESSSNLDGLEFQPDPLAYSLARTGPTRVDDVF